MRVAVVGGGIIGLISAYVLAKEGVEVVLYEKEDYLGGHANAVTIDGTSLDIGLMIFNRVTYPNIIELLESLGIDMEPCDISFSVSLSHGEGCEWGTRYGFSSFFAQKKNILNPYFWKMIRELNKFNNDALKSRGYSKLLKKVFLISLCDSTWSWSSRVLMCFSAYSMLSFFLNRHVFKLIVHPQWLTTRACLQSYVNKVKKELELRGCQMRTSSQVYSVLTNNESCVVTCKNGLEEVYDGCIIAANAPNALKILGKQATFNESRIFGAFQYAYSDIFLHHDNNLMPKNPAAWSSVNFLGTIDNEVYITYWLNTIQNISDTGLPFFMTLNPRHAPKNTLLKWRTSHPIPSVSASKASAELNLIQGKRRIWFCGAHQGYGFHVDGLKAGIHAATSLFGKSYVVEKNPKQMVLSWPESGARLLVTRFLQRFISTGCIILLEEGGRIFTFEGNRKKSNLKVSLRVHTPLFYWKVATEADLGLADAYINGDFSFMDKNEGLLKLFMIFITNTELNTLKLNKKRGWWTPLLFTSTASSAKYFFKNVLRKNTLTQARHNISRHYDLSNELFSLFLDETMAYSCAIFKARIDKERHVLDIGCGWGSLAIEVVKQIGCKYTGITLSEKQLQYVEFKVKEASSQDQIEFLLCDYRQLPKTSKYDRIISCEMLEAVGQYMEEFFRCCESVIAKNGLFILQFTSIADEKYDEFRLSPRFMKENIFPGGCLPSLSRVTSAMAAASRLSVVHLENIGNHCYRTLRCWRENLVQNKSKILALGFDEKFI
ncbi:Cyclopropane-fatty-acyl-phospholipid synthase [Handroanthus impetiginosus]|uniref:Cyclopropane-fatty-acyl-phospholipid synthase n=1 Tax=Handroanthus impetiginosus TaxID=429701 RepID=A0A2G9G8S7_9LAMI|nr:Cyclopropane-fatty-acyl-phospholipid synthase [Handroanthus impetiginosus]